MRHKTLIIILSLILLFLMTGTLFSARRERKLRVDVTAGEEASPSTPATLQEKEILLPEEDVHLHNAEPLFPREITFSE